MHLLWHIRSHWALCRAFHSSLAICCFAVTCIHVSRYFCHCVLWLKSSKKLFKMINNIGKVLWIIHEDHSAATLQQYSCKWICLCMSKFLHWHLSIFIYMFLCRRLKPFTSYKFRMLATNDVGNSLLSKETEAVTTLQDGKTLEGRCCTGRKEEGDKGSKKII